MPELNIPRQRQLMLAAYAILLLSLILQPLYFMAGSYSSQLKELFYFIPALCFGLVVLSATFSVVVEQKTDNATIRNCALHQIRIVLFLVIVGIFSAIQTSSWWRIDSKSFAFLVNLTVVPAVSLLILLVTIEFWQATRKLPKS
jgi:hypothetical protein